MKNSKLFYPFASMHVGCRSFAMTSVNYIVWVLFFIVCGHLALAQPNSKTQQDTTKAKKDSVIYGYKTTRFFYEEDILSNYHKLRTIDTAINHLHRYNFLQRYGNVHQDLGNMGTALRSIYYEPPTQIGTRLGYEYYDLYPVNPAKLRFFNTMSPFTEVYIAQGGNFRSNIRVHFARNVNPLWNIGIFYNRISSNRVFGRSSRRNDEQTLLHNYGIHTNYFSPNQRYKLLASFTYYNHFALETGGYVLDDYKKADSLLGVVDGGLRFQLASAGASATTGNAMASQAKRHIRVYHQYGLLDTVKTQLFHLLNYNWQFNEYTEGQFNYAGFKQILANPNAKGIQSNAVFYAPFQPTVNEFAYFNADSLQGSINYRTTYNLIDNKAGMKGQINKFNYLAYAQLRIFDLTTQYPRQRTTKQFQDTTAVRRGQEFFVGGSLRYQFNDSMKLAVNADYLLTGDYRFRAEFVRGLWQIGYERLSYRPTLMQQRIYGGFFRWDNTGFRNTEADRIFGSMLFKLPLVTLNPHASITNLVDYVYYDTLAQARQSSKIVNMLQVGLNYQVNWRKWFLVGNVIYARNLGFEAMPLPEWLLNTQLYYESHFFEKALFAQIGADLHYKSRYYANTYMPALQEYFLQNKILVEGYPNVDIFVNFRVRRALLFLKLNNALQDFVGKGYYNTPLYFAQSRGVELGVTWMFFD